MSFPVFQSRKEKEFFLKEIINKLNVIEPEKDIYILCIDILDDDEFEIFFIKILKHMERSSEIWEKIEPFNLISQ